MKNKRKKQHRLIFPILFLLLFMMGLTAVYAKDTTSTSKVVRLGYVNSPGYEEGKDNEYKTGLGYEYFQNIAYLKNWEYEYVYGSFSELLTMLEKGEIDVFGNVSYTPERAEKFNYSEYPMGKDVYHMITLSNRYDLREGDIRAYEGKRVGVTQNSYQHKLLLEWLKENDLQMDVVEYSGTEEFLEALNLGKIDCVVNAKFIQERKYVSTLYIGSSDYYFGVSKKRPDLLADINSALYTIQSENPLYNEKLYEKYMSGLFENVVLMQDEEQWLEEHPEIVMGYLDDYLPFSDTNEDGSVGGALQEITKELVRKIQMHRSNTVVYKGYPTVNDLIRAVQNEEVDVAFPIISDLYNCEINGIMQSYTVVSSTLTLFHKGEYYPKSFQTIAINKGNENARIYVQLQYPDVQIVWMENAYDCLDAVRDGKVDGTIFNSSRAQYYDSMREYRDLHMTICPTDAEYVFVVKKGESSLLKLLNRGLVVSDNTYMTSIVNEYTPYYNKFSIRDFIAQNFIEACLIITLTIVFIMMTAFLYVYKTNEAKEQIQKMNEELRRALDNYEKADSDRRTDFLTGLHSRQDMFEILQDLEDAGKPIRAIYLLDVDNFKMLNDHYGHAYGDECLKRIGQALCEYGEQNKMMFYRYGGEEILGISISGKKEPKQMARELVQLVRDQKIQRDDLPTGVVTISLGYSVDNTKYTEMIEKADQAMYYAKNHGKNQAVCYEGMESCES